MSSLLLPDAMFCLLPMIKPIFHHRTFPFPPSSKNSLALYWLALLFTPRDREPSLEGLWPGYLERTGLVDLKGLGNTDALYIGPHTSTEIMFNTIAEMDTLTFFLNSYSVYQRKKKMFK